MKRRNLASLLCLAVFAASAGGCAVMDTGAFVRLQEEVDSVKKEVAGIKSPAASSSRTDGGELQSVRKSMADLTASYDQLKSDQVASTTRADEAKVQMQKENARLNDRVNEQAQTIQEMRAKVAKLGEIEKRLAAAEEKLAAVAPAAASAPAPSEWKSAEEMYDYALGLVKSGETRKGREILASFAGKYPDHKLMPNVVYWKGETFYAEKDYESAILSFQDVIDKYPAGDKAPDAMYKQGLSFLGLRDREKDKAKRKESEENAAFLFKQVQSKYPKSPAAALARQKLSEIK